MVLAHIARSNGHAGFGHQLLGRIFQAHCRNARRCWPDPDEAGVNHRLREFGVFGEETIAGMDSLCAGGKRRGDDLIPHQIALTRRRRPNMHRLIGFLNMQRLGISIRIDRNRANAHGLRRSDNPAGDLAAIGNEKRLDHLGHIRNTPKRGASSTGAFSAAANANPSTSLVCAGSIIPSSQSREVA